MTVRLASVLYSVIAYLLYSVIDCNDLSMAKKNRLKSMLCPRWLKWIFKKDSGKAFKIKDLLGGVAKCPKIIKTAGRIKKTACCIDK